MIKFSLKVSTLATLFLCAECAVPEGLDQCSTTCDLIKGEISSSEACAKSRKSLPRPKIGRVCQEGFDEAFKLTCGELCSLHGTSRAVPSHLGEACDKRKREVPRPVAHKACLDGFKAGLEATTLLVNKKIEAMERDARATLVENNLSMLTQTDPERSRSEETWKAKEVERMKQKEEEEERARRAVKEKSAEVRREKEALSKKQQLEAARAAEDAERNKKHAAEERQARIEATANAKEVKGREKLGSSPAAPDTVESAAFMADAQTHRGSDEDAIVAATAARETPSRTTPEMLEQDESAAGLQEDARVTSLEDASHQEVIQMKDAENSKPATANTESTEWLRVLGEGSRHVGDLEAKAATERSAEENPHQEVLGAEYAQVAGTPKHSSGNVQVEEAAAEKKLHGDAEDKLAIDLLNEPRHREVLMAENVEGFDTQSAEKSEASREHRKDNLVALATITATSNEQEIRIHGMLPPPTS